MSTSFRATLGLLRSESPPNGTALGDRRSMDDLIRDFDGPELLRFRKRVKGKLAAN